MLFFLKYFVRSCPRKEDQGKKTKTFLKDHDKRQGGQNVRVRVCSACVLCVCVFVRARVHEGSESERASLVFYRYHVSVLLLYNACTHL